MQEGQVSANPTPIALAVAAAPVANPTGTAAKVAVGFILVAMLIGLSWTCKAFFDRFGENINKEYSVSWRGAEPLVLEPGPVLFANDLTRHVLTFRGPIDDKMKKMLIELFPKEAKGKRIALQRPNGEIVSCGTADKGPYCQDAEVTYNAAVELLAYNANADRIKLLISLMVVAAAFGAIGSHVRSMSAFVNHVLKKDLDLHGFWPYYFIRPFYGAVFGVLVVTVIKAGFLTAQHGSDDTTLWWISLAFFAGFGDREFAEKIRQIIKALFGEGSEARSGGA
jgi:hypothetical protein